MATSKCGACNSTAFETKVKDGIQGSNFKMIFIQCASCGAVFGITDFYNIPTLLQELAKKLGHKLSL
jgi:hypothetical protein